MTALYRDIEFCTEHLHLPYSEFLKLPRWERKLYDTYLDIKTRRQAKEEERMKLEEEERKSRKGAEDK